MKKHRNIAAFFLLISNNLQATTFPLAGKDRTALRSTPAGAKISVQKQFPKSFI
jgi:hypothetical protein